MLSAGRNRQQGPACAPCFKAGSVIVRMRGWAASQGSWPGAWAWQKCDPSHCPQDLGTQSLCRGERGSVTHWSTPVLGSRWTALSVAPGGPSSPAVVPGAEAALHHGEIGLHQDAWGCVSAGICGPGTETALGSLVLLP